MFMLLRIKNKLVNAIYLLFSFFAERPTSRDFSFRLNSLNGLRMFFSVISSVFLFRQMWNFPLAYLYCKALYIKSKERHVRRLLSIFLFS